MIVCKFGGTSVGDAAAISHLVEIVRARLDQQPVVVVSALSQITDGLAGLATGKAIDPIVDRHQAVADGLGLADRVMPRIRDDARALAQWLLARGNRPLSATDLDHVVFEEPALEVGDAQLLSPHHPVERLARGIEVEARRWLVGDQRHQLPVRMERPQGLEQNPGPVQVREGETGVAQDLHSARSSRSTVSALKARS